MEVSELEDPLNKCRCCLRTLVDEKNFRNISEYIEKCFFELTQLKLVNSTNLSCKICQICYHDLEIFSQFRKDLISKQSLQQSLLFDESPCKSDEPHEQANFFINCDAPTTGFAADMFHPHVLIKSEIPDQKELNLENENDQGADKSLFYCDICSRYFEEKFELEAHMQRSHMMKTEASTFFCEFCSKEFSRRHLLNRHIKLKHTEKQRSHPCPTCNKSFYTLSTLKKHIESHGKKNMPCEFCGKLFSCMNNLRTHLYYHSEPKFVCEIENCGKTFYMRKLLKAHLNVHRGQKDYCCSYCEKSYFFASHLKRHIISVHMKLKIDCEVISCSSSFARKETYRHHILTQHKNLGTENLNVLLAKIRSMKVDEYRSVR